MSDLADLVEPLKREVAVPGRFDADFPDTLDSDLEATLIDAFWESKLDGFFGGAYGGGTDQSGVTVDDTGITTPDISGAAGALVTIYAGVRILRNALRNTATHFRAESSGQVFERDQSAGLLKGLLDALEQRKRQLLLYLVIQPNLATEVHTLDGYAIRGFAFYDYELAGVVPGSYAELAGPAGFG